jgi:hypothetical protein
MIAGILFFFTLVASGRVQFGTQMATQTRYVYVGVVFLLPLVAHALRNIPWRGLWRPALLAVFAVCVFGNLARLHDVAVSLTDYMRIQEAELQTVEVFRGAPDMAVGQFIDNTLIPQLSADTYLAAISELGSPVPRATTTSLQHLQPFAVDRVMLNLFAGAMVISPTGSRSTEELPCRIFDSGAASTLDLLVPSGHSILLQSTGGGDSSLYLSYLDPPRSQAQWQGQLTAATPIAVYLPDTGKPVNWRLRVTMSKPSPVQVCGAGNIRLAPIAG